MTISWVDIVAAAFIVYGVACIFKGSVRVRGGLSGQTVLREKSPALFWFSCLLYIAIGIGLDLVLRRHWSAH